MRQGVCLRGFPLPPASIRPRRWTETTASAPASTGFPPDSYSQLGREGGTVSAAFRWRAPGSSSFAVPSFFVAGNVMADLVAGMPDVVRRKVTIRSRFSTLRYNKVVKQFNPIQRGHIIRNGFPLNLPGHLMVPMPLTKWIIDHIEYGCEGVFKHKSKSFVFYKDFVNAIFGFDYGSRKFVLSSSDPAVIAEVELLKARYTVNGKIPVSKVVTEMLADDTEDGFMRSFMMFFTTTVLCPRTLNFVDPRILYSLRKVSNMRKLDYGDFCWNHLMTEIDKYKDKLDRPVKSNSRTIQLWVGGCLPVLTIAYMDHVDFKGEDEGFDYDRPRIYHVRQRDFDLLELLDRERTSRKSYGVLEIKDISLTPYAELYRNPEHLHALQGLPDSDDEGYMLLLGDNDGPPDAAPDAPVFADNPEIHQDAPHMYVVDIPDDVAPSTPVREDHSQISNNASSALLFDNANLLADHPQPQNVDALIDEVLAKHQAKWQESHQRDLKDNRA